jgi:ABC-type multidrug transport system ATPase subunit
LATRNSVTNARSITWGVTFHEIEKRYGALQALRGVSLEIRAGEFVALLGANGAGKTTLLRIAALLATPTRGDVRFRSPARAAVQENLREMSRDPEMKKLVGYVGHSTLLYDELTAAENLEFFAKLYASNGADASTRTHAQAALVDCGLGTRANGLVRTFSRGMRQRLAIAKALLHGPRIVLLDEPAAGLDKQGLAWFSARLEQLRADGATVLMSTHARNESLDLATRVVSLANGTIAEDSGADGDPAALLAKLREDSR